MATEITTPLWRALAETDPEVAQAIRDELHRQNTGLELIASENFVSRAVLEAAGSVMTNKYAEGYPGKRYYGGCEFVDVAERAAIARAKTLFGADHAGFLLKEHLKHTLTRLGHSVEDLGTNNEESVDYPPFCAAVARAVASGEAERGLVFGGSGQGEQITANKIRGIRAALCHDLYTARLSRQHNDANVLSMGGRIVAPGLADEIVALWLKTPFEGGRHQRRIDQIAAAERKS